MVYDSDMGVVAYATTLFAPQLMREDKEGAGLDIDRLDGLRAWNVVERVVQRLALEPCEGLHPLGTECRVGLARVDLAQSLLDGRTTDERRCSVRQHIEVSLDLASESIVDILAQRGVAVE